MQASSDSVTDSARLLALRQATLLDTEPEEAFDRLTRLASRILGVPISLVSLVDKDRQFFKSQIGLPSALAEARETPLTHSFCRHVVLSGEALIVEDARQHPVLKDNLAVPLGVIAYAGMPLVTADGHVLGSFCAIDSQPRTWTSEQLETLRDLAASVMTEIELRRRNAELHQANVAKDRFMAMLSHDLRTPITPALLTAAELLADASLPDAAREDVRLIYRNIELQVRMIDSLMDLTRINAGKMSLRLEDLELQSELCAAAQLCGADAAAKSIDVRLERSPGRHALRGDRGKLQQLFCNVLKNAIKFSHVGGTVMVRAAEADAQTLEVSVSDQGIGIAASVLPKIFEPYEQAETARDQRFGGLGLGLAICKGIVEAHGGSIEAASAGVGLGTKMTVRLPAGKDLPAVGVEAGPVDLPRSAPLRILLVEDHEDSLRAMSRLLRKLDHHVTTATNVTNALQAAEERQFDLLISDLGLPDGTGLEIMRELLTRGSVKGIALTGYGMESDVRETREAGFEKHLTKPVSFQDLEDAIREMA